MNATLQTSSGRSVTSKLLSCGLYHMNYCYFLSTQIFHMDAVYSISKSIILTGEKTAISN